MNVGKWLGDAMGGTLSDLVGTLGDQVDRFVKTKEDADELKRAIQKSVQNYKLSLQQELTQRHKQDMNSDSWLSKNIRPIVLFFSLILLTVLAVADGNLVIRDWTFTVQDSYVALLEQILTAALMFYFGGREVNKMFQSWNARQERQDQMKHNQSSKNQNNE